MKTCLGLSSGSRVWRVTAALVSFGSVALMQGCSTPPSPSNTQASQTTTATLPQASTATLSTSLARNAKAYRRDAASHLYAHQPEKIFKGRLPPMLYAVGVLDVDIDKRGQVQALRWQRAPKHAPEVMAEIEKLVRAAAPYPAPQHMAKVTYTDVWLWHKSGRFQLDTLTEGQD
jgi:periplasmic protein TonB